LAAVDDDDLLIDAGHFVVEVDSVERKAEGLALAKPGDRTKQDKRRVAAGHGISQGEHLSGGQKPDHSWANLWQADIVARGLTDIPVPDCSAHDAREYHVKAAPRGRSRRRLGRRSRAPASLPLGWPLTYSALKAN
jgi:hypothetical protein